MWIAYITYKHNGVVHKESLKAEKLEEYREMLSLFIRDEGVEDSLIEVHIIKDK